MPQKTFKFGTRLLDNHLAMNISKSTPDENDRQLAGNEGKICPSK
jgi:hypothetical protein